MRILAVSGSTRADSLNTALARLVVELRPADAVTVRADLARLPFYDAALEAAGIPAPVADLRHAVQAADLLVLATPEYNGTIPGVLGNALDWLSRPHGRSVLAGKRALVVSASPSPGGGTRAAEQLRALLARVGADVLPQGLSVPRAHMRLAASGPDPQLPAELDRLLTDAATPAPTALPA